MSAVVICINHAICTYSSAQNGVRSANMGSYAQAVFCVQGGVALHWKDLDVIFLEKAKNLYNFNYGPGAHRIYLV